LARCVAKECSCDALRAIPVSQAGSFVMGGREEVLVVSAAVGVGEGVAGAAEGGGDVA
jgi:hypothetical protein